MLAWIEKVVLSHLHM